MNLIFYLFTGLMTAFVGALPLGTTNVAVINTTIKENLQNALKIIYTAAIAELILVVIALNFNTQIEGFIQMNTWIQYVIAFILFGVGMVLIFGKKERIRDENDRYILIKKRRFSISKQMLGFILGLINPPVLIYWILVISFLNKNMIYLNLNIEYILLILFFIGVFSGKAIILFGYGKFSHLLKIKMTNITIVANRIIGILLLSVSIFQFTKAFYV